MISSMKKKISIAVLGVGVLATPCFAMFGEDIAYLLQIISQGRQMIQIGQQAKAQFEQAASFVRNPGGWRNLLSRGQAALDQYRTVPTMLPCSVLTSPSELRSESIRRSAISRQR
jgi:hypothetical protein